MKVLYVSSGRSEDYQRDVLFHGLRELLGTDAVDVGRIVSLYEQPDELKHALYEAFFCEGEDIATDLQIALAAERAGLDPAAAVASSYAPELLDRIREVRAEAEAAGVRGVPSLVGENGESHWGMGGLDRLLAGVPLLPRAT